MLIYALLYIVVGIILAWASYLLGGKPAFFVFVGLFLLGFLPYGIALPFAPMHALGLVFRWKLSLSFIANIAILIGGDKPVKMGAWMALLLTIIMLIPILMVVLFL